MAFLPSKPSHNRYAFRNLNSTDYATYAKQYSRAKAGGIRCIYTWATGAGVIGIVKDVSKGIVIDYGKRKFATFCLAAGSYILSPAIVVFTNMSKVVNVAKRVHTGTAYCFELVEDSSNLVFLPIDMALFGQPIPVGANNRFNMFTNHTDFLDG